MGNIHYRLAVVVFLGCAMASHHTIAGSPMSADEVKKLIVGNTAYGTLSVSGKPIKNYFGPNGTLVRSVGGKVKKGSYSINDDGTQCVNVGKADNCAKIVNNGDGTYHRVSSEGKVLLKWDKVASGKDIP